METTSLSTRLIIDPTVIRHGGRRDGAGRPANLSKQLKEARVLAKQLKSGVDSGLKRLARDYDILMETAIDMAKKGDRTVLLRLLEIGVRAAGNDNDEDDSFKKLVRKWQYTESIPVEGIPDGDGVDGEGQGYVGPSEPDPQS